MAQDKPGQDKPRVPPVASGGKAPVSPGFTGNKTIGRIKTLQCSRDDAASGAQAAARQRLNDQQQRFADHVSGKAPLPPAESLALRSDIDRLSQIVSPGTPNMWGEYSAAEKAHLAQQVEQKRRFANNLGMMAGGPVLAGLPMAGRLLGAPESVVENLGTLNVDLVGMGALRKGIIEPVQMRGPGTLPRPIKPPAAPGNGLYVDKPAKPAVTYTTKQLDKKFKHAEDFDVKTSKKNPQTLKEYEEALKGHMGDPATIQHGTYVHAPGSTVYYNPNTNNVLVVDKGGNFLSGWKLDPTAPTKQFSDYVNHGKLF